MKDMELFNEIDSDLFYYSVESRKNGICKSALKMTQSEAAWRLDARSCRVGILEHHRKLLEFRAMMDDEQWKLVELEYSLWKMDGN
jgi:hypothetical protein